MVAVTCEVCLVQYEGSSEEVAQRLLVGHQIRRSHFLALPGKRTRVRNARYDEDYDTRPSLRKRARASEDQREDDGPGAPTEATSSPNAAAVGSDDESCDEDSFDASAEQIDLDEIEVVEGCVDGMDGPLDGEADNGAGMDPTALDDLVVDAHANDASFLSGPSLDMDDPDELHMFRLPDETIRQIQTSLANAQTSRIVEPLDARPVPATLMTSRNAYLLAVQHVKDTNPKGGKRPSATPWLWFEVRGNENWRTFQVAYCRMCGDVRKAGRGESSSAAPAQPISFNRHLENKHGLTAGLRADILANCLRGDSYDADRLLTLSRQAASTPTTPTSSATRESGALQQTSLLSSLVTSDGTPLSASRSYSGSASVERSRSGSSRSRSERQVLFDQLVADTVLGERLVFRFFERPLVKDLVSFLDPKLVLPHRKKVKNLVILRAEDVRLRFGFLLLELAKAPSITVDTWSDRRMRGYMGATISFVIMEPEPRLITGVLGFLHAPGKHDAVSLAGIFTEMFARALPTVTQESLSSFMQRCNFVTDGHRVNWAMATNLDVGPPLWCVVHRASLFMKDVVKQIEPFSTVVGLSASLVSSMKNSSVWSQTDVLLQPLAKTRFFTAFYTVKSVLRNRQCLMRMLEDNVLPPRAAAICRFFPWSSADEFVDIFVEFVGILPDLSAAGSAYMVIPCVATFLGKLDMRLKQLWDKVGVVAVDDEKKLLESMAGRLGAVRVAFVKRFKDVYTEKRLIAAFMVSGWLSVAYVCKGKEGLVNQFYAALRQVFERVASDTLRVCPATVRRAVNSESRATEEQLIESLAPPSRGQSSVSTGGTNLLINWAEHMAEQAGVTGGSEQEEDRPSGAPEAEDAPLTKEEVEAAWTREKTALDDFRRRKDRNVHRFSMYTADFRRRCPVLTAVAIEYLALDGSSIPTERLFSAGGLTVTALRNRLDPATADVLLSAEANYRLLRLLIGKEWTRAPLIRMGDGRSREGVISVTDDDDEGDADGDDGDEDDDEDVLTAALSPPVSSPMTLSTHTTQRDTSSSSNRP